MTYLQLSKCGEGRRMSIALLNWDEKVSWFMKSIIMCDENRGQDKRDLGNPLASVDHHADATAIRK